MKKFLFLLLAVFASLPSSAFASQLTQLAQHPYWLQLGHYTPASLTKWKSEVDDPRFFLAELGKLNPLDELTATIKAFNGANQTPEQTQQIRCAFPARYTWLKDKIENTWPALDCPKLNLWQKTINPSGITLVFPTAFMNSPSSMFGHTLLRIDAKDQTRHRELVAFAVNFAAQPEATDNAAVYAFKGLVGKYPGTFTVMPYYKKVREYNDIESRDIWEYKLNLSEQEVHNILLHLWELQQATFDYYFIDENCSYQLLSLLQLANEELSLTQEFPYQAIPSDTVAVLHKNGLLNQPNYRPSFGTRLHHYSTQLSSGEMDAVRQLMRTGQFDGSLHSPERRAAIIEMAYEWLNFNFNDKGLKRDKFAPQLTKLLRQRSQIKAPSPFTPPIAPLASPESGHNSSRVSLTTLYSKEYANRALLSYRFAYHDLLDRPVGYIPGAKISFLDTGASISRDGHIRIEHLNLIDAMSLAPDNQIFDSWSWAIKLGFDRQSSLNKQQGRVFGQASFGKSFGNPNLLHTYILGSIELNGGEIAKGIEPGLGTQFGAVWQINPHNKVALSANVMWLIDSPNDHHSQVDLSWNWALDRNLALRTQVKHNLWQAEDSQAHVTLHFYY